MTPPDQPSADPRAFCAIIVAGGRGERAGLDRPKQLTTLGGRPVLEWSVAAFLAHPSLSALVLVVPAGQSADYARTDGVIVVEGGASRRESVAHGLTAIADTAAQTPVLIHDAARPGVSHGVIDRLLDRLSDIGVDGAVPSLPVADTLAANQDGALGPVADRSGLARIQTPQAFRYSAIRMAHDKWQGDEPTDDAQMVRAAGGKVALVSGDEALHKLTYADDVALLECRLMPPMRTAVGSGYDVHRLESGTPLWLGGLEIAHSHGLAGHSDADVALHAITDAIFGALAEGDIGSHFPPSDPQWRGAASHRFLEFARDRVRDRGGRISHIDLTIICEAPKIGPHRDAMRARIADILAIPMSYVSVKATTTERLGFTGRGEGIAAQATATLMLKETEE